MSPSLSPQKHVLPSAAQSNAEYSAQHKELLDATEHNDARDSERSRRTESGRHARASGGASECAVLETV